MTLFEELKATGKYDDYDIRDVILEDNYDVIKQLEETGKYDDEQILSVIAEDNGIPMNLFDNKPALDNDISKEASLKKETINNLSQLDKETKDLASKKIDIDAQNKQKEKDKEEDPDGFFSYFKNALTQYGEASQNEAQRLTEDQPAQSEMMLKGASRPALGLARAFTKLLPEEYNADVFAYIEKNEASINKLMKENNISPDMINAANVGELVMTMLPLSRAAGLFTTGFQVGGVSGVSAYGSGKDAGESALAGAKDAALTIGGGMVLGAAARIVSSIGDISFTTKKMIKELEKSQNVNPDDIAAVLKGVPKEEQAEVLANSFGQKFMGNYKQAIAYSDRLKRKLADNITEKSKSFDEAVGVNDFADIKYNAQEMYKSLEKTMDDIGFEVDVTDLTDGLSTLKTLGGASDTMIAKINTLAKRTELTPNMSGKELLEVRTEVNSLISKYIGKNNSAYKLADSLKTNIDNKIKNEFPEGSTKYIDDTLSKYTIFKEQETINNVISNNKFVAGKGGGGEEYAYDYSKIITDLEAENLLTEEARIAVNTVQQINFKFGNDFEMFKATKGIGTAEQGGFLGFFGAVVNLVKRPIGKMLPIESGFDLKVQDEIRKGINSSNSGAEFIYKLSKNQNISKDIRKSMIDNLGNVKTSTKKEENMLKFVSNSNLGIKGSSTPTKSPKGKSAYDDVSDSLYGTKKTVPTTSNKVSPEDNKGNLGFGSDMGGKPTAPSRVKDNDSQRKLTLFMRGVAEGKIQPNNSGSLQEVITAAKKEGLKLFKGKTKDKTPYNKMMKTLGSLGNKKKLNEEDTKKLREIVKQVLKDSK